VCSRLLGLTCTPCEPWRFLVGSWGRSARNRSPQIRLKTTVHPLMGFGASSALSQSRSARSPKCPSTFHGVRSPIATSEPAGSTREFPGSRRTRSTLRVSHPLGVCFLPRPLVALFHATTTSGVLPPGGFPREQPRSPFGSRVPSCRWLRFAYQPESWRQRASARLQGL